MKEKRRVSSRKIGGKDYYQMVMPKKWVVKNGLDKTPSVIVKEFPGGALLIKPNNGRGGESEF